MLNATNGVSSRVYTANGFDKLYGPYLVDSQTLFTLTRNTVDRVFHIIVYHLSNDSFTEYKFTSADFYISDISYFSSNSRLLLFGRYTFEFTYAVDTLVDTIVDIADVNIQTTGSFIQEDIAQYQLTTVPTSSPTRGSVNVSNFSTSLTVTTKTINITTDEYSSDLVYDLSTPTSNDYHTLVEGWNKTLPINLTCSLDGNTSLEHVIENYESYTAPTWIELDDANFQLNVSAPEVTSDTEYYFRIRTNEVGSSTNYYKLVNLTVQN